MANKIYTGENVLEASRRRIAWVFDRFERVNVSISGGKDSTVLAYLALQEARRRDRKVGFFFLDEEVVYQATIDQVSWLMDIDPEHVIRYWLQIPFHLTNTTSYDEPYCRCWDRKDKPRWMRKRDRRNILYEPWSHETVVTDKVKGLDFYDVLTNWEMANADSASLVGLRADESPNRYYAVTRYKGYEDIYWSSVPRGCAPHFYPIYDWSFMDIWHYIAEERLRYHAYYDFALKKGTPPNVMRVSSLVHEKAFKCLAELPEFEPETYQKLCDRIKGISFAQETAKDRKMYKCLKLPDGYRTWKDYRDFLLAHYRTPAHVPIFEKRFSKHLENEYVHRQQCRQLVCGDYENNLPVKNTPDPREMEIERWRSIL